jgi:hypothetical protein
VRKRSSVHQSQKVVWLRVLIRFSTSQGFSLPSSLLCLHYLFKNWQKKRSHLIITVFTILLSTFNIAVYGMRAASVVGGIQPTMVCPSDSEKIGSLSLFFTFWFTRIPAPLIWSYLNGPEKSIALASGLSASFIPVFLWFSDGFVVSMSVTGLSPLQLEFNSSTVLGLFG